VVARRFEVYLVSLNPAVGVEIQKTRPCLIISPDQMNQHIRTVIIAPITTRIRHYPTRVGCEFDGRTGQIVLDQIRAVDTSRLVRRLGVIAEETQHEVLAVLRELFAG
jgi:mRNA interferase MazF